jgi:rhomboid family GlyGly-CTERM serine protease
VTSEPWRLVSAHIVHVDGRHAALNAVGWLVLARLFAADVSGTRQASALVAGGLFISAGLWFFVPGIAWYRGLSGALHALFFAGVTLQLGRALRHRVHRDAVLPLILMAGGLFKLAREHPWTATPGYSEWLGIATVPQAHLLGGLCGVALGLLWCAREGLSRDAARDAG